MLNKTKFIIKNVETNEYFVGWELVRNDKGHILMRKGLSNGAWGDVPVKVPSFSTEQSPKLYNTYGGARKIISEFAGSSFAKQDKLKPTEKVLFGDAKLAKYEIIECKIKLVEVKSRGKKA